MQLQLCTQNGRVVVYPTDELPKGQNPARRGEKIKKIKHVLVPCTYMSTATVKIIIPIAYVFLLALRSIL